MKNKSITTLTLLVLMTSVPTPGICQLFGDREPPQETPSTEFVPNSAFVGATFFPKQIIEDPNFKLIPREIFTAAGKKELGFDPMLIKQATFIIKSPESLPVDSGPPIWATVLHFEKIQGLSGKIIDQFEEKKLAGKTLYSSGQPSVPSFLVFDELTILFGDERFFEELLTGGDQGDLSGLMKAKNIRGQLLGFVDVAKVAPYFKQVLESLPDEMLGPPPVKSLTELFDLLQSVELGVDAKNKFEIKLLIHAKNEQSAEKASKIITDALEFARSETLKRLVATANLEDPVQASTIVYTRRIWDKYQEKYTPSIKGSDLSLTINEEIIVLPYLIRGL